MDWNDIRLLIEIHRAGSFSGAAAAMGVHQATVSRRLTLLEDAAGARIFKRTPFGAELTDVGGALLQMALRIDDGVEQFKVALQTTGHQPLRSVTVRASEGVAGYLLTPLIAEQELGPLAVAARRLGAQLPALSIVPPHAPDKADISIVWTALGELPEGRPDDKIRKLATITFVPFATDAYFRRGAKAPESWDELAGHKLITLSNYRQFAADAALGPWNAVVGEAGPAAVPTYWTSAMGQLTLDGAGISLMPNYVPMYAGHLRPLEITAPAMRCDLWLQAGAEDLKDPTIRRCYSLLAQMFGEFDW